MFVAKKGISCGQRRIEQRHVNFLVRSLRSNSPFESRQQRQGLRSFASHRLVESISGRDERSESESSKTLLGPESSSLIPHRNNLSTTANSSTTRFVHYKSHHDSMDSLTTALLSGSSQKAALNLVRSTATSPSAYRSIIYQSFDSALGLSFHDPRIYQKRAESRAYFSSDSKKQGGFSTSAKIPTPKSQTNISLNPLASIDPQAMVRGAFNMTWSLTKMVMKFLLRLPGNSWFVLTHPKERKEKIQEIKDMARKEFDHYWMGSKLLMADVRTARNLFGKTLSGSTLTRRERKQLLRTTSDLFRLVPFSMFILIPFMEFVLPFALRLFPNMLPSTFQDSLKAEENMKRELRSRINMAQFFQETLEELAKEQKRIAAKRNTETPDNTIAVKQEESAASMLEFLEKARNGEMVPPDVIVQYAHFFKDDLTLDNMPRMQLINMCKYMSIPPYGADSFLRFQLRHKIRTLKEDDQRILWEGIDALTKMELREACQERGMRSTGMSKEAYKRSLQQWLDLSVNKNVPISLLIMSRIFFLQEEFLAPSTDDDTKSVTGLADAISGLDKEVWNEVILEVATSEERKSSPDVRKIKLEVLDYQNEKIREEQAEREAATKKKESSNKGEVPEETLVDEEVDLSPEGTPASEFKTDKKETVVLEATNVSDSKETELGSEGETEKSSEEDKDDHDLSAEELDAITELLSADPVSKEREQLAKIKSAMKEKYDEEVSGEEITSGAAEMNMTDAGAEEGVAVNDTPKIEGDGDEYVAEMIEANEKKAAEEADKSTIFSTDSEIPLPKTTEEVEQLLESIELKQTTDEDESDEPEDPIVARLKKRIETMVDKIEVQLSDAQVKIGDKLHFLDKDMDGILSREEMADCLQQVMKRKITFEEAMEIASEMDENEDGVFTVQELIKWIETNKLVKLVSEGWDADMDTIMENQSSENQKDENVQSEEASQQPAQGEKATK